MIPGLQVPAADTPIASSSPSAPSYTRNAPAAEATHVPGTAAQQAFISQVAPGAIAMQSRYGVPAAVTIAQAIDESGWGQSALAIRDNNLFGIKGTGPAGTDMLPTQEYQNGQYVTVNAPFRVYHNVAESIADHGHLLATGASYQHAMSDRHLPDAFATDLTGVYATDPHYGSSLIAIMKLYNLYRYSAPDAQQAAPSASRALTGRALTGRGPAGTSPQAPASQAGRAGWPAGRDGQHQRHGEPGRHVRPGRRRQRERAGQPASPGVRPKARPRARWPAAGQVRQPGQVRQLGPPRRGAAAVRRSPAFSTPTSRRPPVRCRPTQCQLTPGPRTLGDYIRPTTSRRTAAAAHARAPLSDHPAARVAPRQAGTTRPG